jgi:hypothetical protein
VNQVLADDPRLAAYKQAAYFRRVLGRGGLKSEMQSSGGSK